MAQQVASDGTVLWDEAGCVPLGGATTLYLRNGTAGNTASHYQTASVTFECTPEIPDGGVDGGAGDQGVSDGGVDGGLASLLECDRTHLVIESVDTETNEITLYNPTGTAITTSGNYQLAHDLGFEAVPALTFPAYGRMTFDAPGIIELGANQTLALYTTASFGTRDAMVDYMCWGTGGTRPYLSVARTVGSDGTVLWDAGGCTAAATDATVYRVPSAEGNTAADYTTTMPTEALDCSPPITG